MALSFLLSKKTFSAKSQCISASAPFLWQPVILNSRPFAQHVHWSSGINHEFSFLWWFWNTRRHCLNFYRRIKRSSVLNVEFVNIYIYIYVYRQFPCCLVGTHFWITRRDGPFSRFFFLVPRVLGECDTVCWSQFSFFPENRCSQMYTPSRKQLILPHHPSFIFCWASPPPQHVEYGIFAIVAS